MTKIDSIRMVGINNSITALVIVTIFASFFTIILPVDTCHAATIYVSDSDILQEKIDDADPGDTIIVYDGSYSNILIDKTLTLKAEGSNVQISSSSENTVKITANDVQMTGFKVYNDDKAHFCIYLYYSSGCQIENNQIRYGSYGVYLQFSDSNTINDNTISSNNMGIYISNSDSNIVYSNVISNNNANGVFIPSTSNDNTLYLNDFDDNLQSNARDEGSNNWDDGSSGNYWDDYNDVDDNEDGIGDNPYTIYGISGSQDTKPKGDFITINNAPIATINSPSSSQTITQGDSISFSGIGEDPDSGDTIEAYNWRSNIDGQLKTQPSFSTSSLSVGAHTIYFKVMDNHDTWSDEKSVSVTVQQSPSQNQKPTASISKPSSSVTKLYGETVEFLGQGTDDGQVIGYSWRSDRDGTLSSSRQFTKTDLSIGQHTIYFKVKDNLEVWSNEVSVSVKIDPDPSSQNNPPIADVGGPYSGYVNQSFSFDGSASSDPDSGDSITKYQWDFGDGSTALGIYAAHAYTSEGEYTVELTVFDSNGLQSKDSITVQIEMDSNNQGNGDNDNGEDTPGFEAIFFIISILIIIYLKRKKE